MKRTTFTIAALFILTIATMAMLNAHNGSGKSMTFASALPRKGSPTPTPSGKANANIPAKAAANTKANANTTVAPAKVGNTNINADTSNRDRVANMNSNSAPKMLTEEECEARVKKALANVKPYRRYPTHQHFTVFDDDSKKTAKDKMVKKPKEVDAKIATVPAKNTDSKMVKTPKTQPKATLTEKKPTRVAKKISKPAKKPAAKTSLKPAAKKPPTVAKDSKSTKKSDKKSTVKKQDKVKKFTPNLDDVSLEKLKKEQEKSKRGEVAKKDDKPIDGSTAGTGETEKPSDPPPPPPVATIGDMLAAKWTEFKSIPSVISNGSQPPDSTFWMVFKNPFTWFFIIGLPLLFFIVRWAIRKIRAGGGMEHPIPAPTAHP